MAETVQLNDLSQKQLEFTQAGITKSPNWVQLEKNLPLSDQIKCLRYVAMEPNPLPKVQEKLREFQIPQHSMTHER